MDALKCAAVGGVKREKERTMQESSEGMISVKDFAKQKGLSELKAIEMIREGFYVGRKIGDDWFVQTDELNNKSSSKPSISSQSTSSVSSIVVTDIQMPFWSMVVFMVKAAIAFIPAFIILICLGVVASIMFGGVIGGLTY